MRTFFHLDLDGHCAGAIVHNVYAGVGEYVEINYNIPFPFHTIQPEERVIIVDFSLPPDQMKQLVEITEDIIWIDHHKTAIEQLRDFEWLPGRRVLDKPAGCCATWDYFHPAEARPAIVQYLGDYDTWTFAFGKEKMKQVQAGIQLEETRPTSKNWDRWLKDIDIEKLEENGKVALRYRANYQARLLRSFGYETVFEGHKAIVLNMGIGNSEAFDSLEEQGKKYDIMICTVFDGARWTVCVYSKNKVDCAEIAKKHGGGGHTYAAGFQIKELPFHKSTEVELNE